MAKFAESVNWEIARIGFFGSSRPNGPENLGGLVNLYAARDHVLVVASIFPDAPPALS